MKESISITRDSMTQSWTFFEESSLPRDLSRLLGGQEILVSVTAPDLVGGQHEVTYSWSSMTPMDKSIFVIT